MRINPILDWKFSDIWSFHKLINVEYCKLYDEGYTYLGNKNNTFKNEYLKNDDGSYRPAYSCPDDFEGVSRTTLQV